MHPVLSLSVLAAVASVLVVAPAQAHPSRYQNPAYYPQTWGGAPAYGYSDGYGSGWSSGYSGSGRWDSGAVGYGAPPRAYVDPACAQRVRNRQITGGLVGGALGLALGRGASDRKVRPEGGALGAVAGALIGSQVGRSSIICPPVQTYAPSAPAPTGWSGAAAPGWDGYGHAPSTVSQGWSQPAAPAHECQWGETTVRDAWGGVQTVQTRVCRGPDGVWRAE